MTAAPCWSCGALNPKAGAARGSWMGDAPGLRPLADLLGNELRGVTDATGTITLPAALAFQIYGALQVISR